MIKSSSSLTNKLFPDHLDMPWLPIPRTRPSTTPPVITVSPGRRDMTAGTPTSPMNSTFPVPQYQLRVDGIATQGAKSRVETQIKVTLRLVDSGSGTQLLDVFQRLRIPDLLVANSRWKYHTCLAYDPTSPCQAPVHWSKCVWLRGWLQCASSPSKLVRVCPVCVLRETKRAAHQKQKIAKTSAHWPSTHDMPQEPDSSDDLAMSNRKTMLIHAPALMDFTSGEAFLPIRIPCYCRHQNEKVGYILHFQLVTEDNVVVAQGHSPPIQITDDHKSLAKKPAHAAPQVPRAKRAAQPLDLFAHSGLTHDSCHLNICNAPCGGLDSLLPSPCASPPVPWPSCIYSPTHVAGTTSIGVESPNPAKRQCVHPEMTHLHAPSGSDVPSFFHHPDFTPHPPFVTDVPSLGHRDAPPTTELPPFSHHNDFTPHAPPGLPSFDACPGLDSSNCTPMLTSSVLETPTSFPVQPYNLSAQVPAQGRLAPLETVNLDSIQNFAAISQPLSLNASPLVPANLPTLMHVQWPIIPTPTTPTYSFIDQVIPSEGPVVGGIDVTILGSGFHSGVTVQFGDNVASTAFCSPGMLICKLPPSLLPGTVNVVLVVYSCYSHPVAIPSNGMVPVFKYNGHDGQTLVSKKHATLFL